MAFPKISDVLNGQGVAGAIYDVASREAVNYGSRKAISYANGLVSDGLNKLVNKNKDGINKVLKALGLDLGGNSNIYDKVAGRPDPLLDFEFMVYMPDISTPWAQAQALDPYWIEDIDVPLETFDVDELKVNGHPVKVMMYSSQPEATIQLYSEYQAKAYAYFNAWYSSIRTKNGRYNLPYAPNNMGYKKLIQVVIMKGPMPVAILSLSGVMPTQRNGFESTSAGGDRRTYSQTVSLDKVYLEILQPQDPNKTSVGNAGTLGGTIASNAIGSLSTTISRSIRGF